MAKIYYKKNPLKLWCNPNTVLTKNDLDELNTKILSHILLKQAYNGNGCWDFNKMLLAYFATIKENERLGKFSNISTTLAKKLIIVEDAVMLEYVNYDYAKISDYIDKQHFETLRKLYSKKI